MKRRNFIKTSVKAITAACIAPGNIWSTAKAFADVKKISKVVIATNAKLVTGVSQIEKTSVRSTLDEALVALTGKSSVRDAWMSIFPNLNTQDTIGLKVNCVNPKLSTHPEVAHAIVESLTMSLGVNPNNILIWDRTDQELIKSGYTLNRGKEGMRCFGTINKLSKNTPLFNMSPDGYAGYDKNALVNLGDGASVHLSRILTEMCTYLINVPVLKDHSYGAGVTLSLKNHYGSISKPQICHGGGGDPYIGNLNNLSHIKDKTKLIVCDGLLASYNKGPYGPPQWVSHRLIASADPVAHDLIGGEIIDKKRIENGLDPVIPNITWFKTAVRLGLGTNDPRQIEKILL